MWPGNYPKRRTGRVLIHTPVNLSMKKPVEDNFCNQLQTRSVYTRSTIYSNKLHYSSWMSSCALKPFPQAVNSWWPAQRPFLAPLLASITFRGTRFFNFYKHITGGLDLFALDLFARCGIFLPHIGSFCHQKVVWNFIGSFCHLEIYWNYVCKDMF